MNYQLLAVYCSIAVSVAFVHDFADECIVIACWHILILVVAMAMPYNERSEQSSGVVCHCEIGSYGLSLQCYRSCSCNSYLVARLGMAE